MRRAPIPRRKRNSGHSPTSMDFYSTLQIEMPAVCPAPPATTLKGIYVTAPQSILQHSPPEPLLVLAECIPDELKARPQWVNWKYAWDGKKWTKHPYNPRTGRKASSTDLLTWSPFKDVLEAYEAGGYHGVGIVLCSGDPYTGVDLDGCRNPETDELEDWAEKIVAAFGGYAEVSPSGTGVHIIVRGKAPNKKRGGIEAYSSERFFTVTGEKL